MKKFFLYGINGAINTTITYVMFILVSKIIDYRIAIVIVYIFGIYLSFILNRKLVFGVHGHLHFFVFINLILMLINLAITWSLVEFLHLAKEVAQLFTIMTIFIFGFLLNKRFTFPVKPIVTIE
jgi:putative flippase GtrA